MEEAKFSENAKSASKVAEIINQLESEGYDPVKVFTLGVLATSQLDGLVKREPTVQPLR